MRIGILSQWFDPETGPAALPGVYAREFVRAGNQVAVLTGFPNYPEGQIYEGYTQRLRTVEEADGITVTRVPLYANHSRSAVGRVMNYSSFATSAAVLGTGALRDVDAIWVYNSPITVHAPLMIHSRRGAVPYFLHVQDLWPESLTESGMIPGGRIGSSIGSAAARVVQSMERHAAAIGIISPSVRELILDRNPDVNPDRIVFAPNPANEQLFRPIRVSSRSDPAAPFTILYAGAMGDVQGLETVIEAVDLLTRSGVAVRLDLAGDGIARERLESLVAERNASGIRFLGRVPQQRVPELMVGADAHLVSLADSPFLRRTMPSKIPSLLASQVPILGVIAGDGADVLRESGAAVVAQPGNRDSVISAIRSLAAASATDLASLGERGRRYYESRFAAEASARTIIEALEGMTGGN